MSAIWILLGIAVLFGGAILAFVVHAIRHDDSASRIPADTEVGRFREEPGDAQGPEAAGRPLASRRAVPAGRGTGVTP